MKSLISCWKAIIVTGFLVLPSSALEFKLNDITTDDGGINSSYPKLLLSSTGSLAVPDEYMVVLDEGTVTDVSRKMGDLLQVVNERHPEVEAVALDDPWNIKGEFIGQALKMTQVQAQTMSLMGGVKYIEQDEIHMFDDDENIISEYGMDRDEISIGVQNMEDGNNKVQSWGLDRIDQREGLNKRYSPDPKYTGKGVTVYVVDSGVYKEHKDFGGRVSRPQEKGKQKIFVNDGKPVCPSPEDRKTRFREHGTHVAGIIGGKKYGVAKGVKLVDVRVAKCDGSSWKHGVIVAALRWIAKNHSEGRAVVNASFGGYNKSEKLKAAIREVVRAGIVFVDSAGNDGVDACKHFESAYAKDNKDPIPDMISVGAIDNKDRIWVKYEDEMGGKIWYERDLQKKCKSPEDCEEKDLLTNNLYRRGTGWGECVDIFAPGVDIVTAGYWKGKDFWVTKSGTSFAAPHVAGAAALILEQHPTWTPKKVKAELIERSTKAMVRADIMPLTGIRADDCAGCRLDKEMRLNKSPDRLLFIPAKSTESKVTKNLRHS